MTGGLFYYNIGYYHRTLKRRLPMNILNDKREKFERIIKKAARIAILGSHQDPDWYAIAMIMLKIVNFYGKFADVFSSGVPGRRQNTAIINTFQLNFLPITQFVARRKDYDCVILVDSHSLEDERFGIKIDGRPDVIVDHHEHPADIVEDENSVYIFQQSGACASLGASMLFECGIQLARNDANDQDLATLCLVGVLADTYNLTSLYVTDLDREMFAAMGKYADQKKINEVFLSSYEKEYFDFLHLATNPASRKQSGTTLITCLGYILPSVENYEHYMVDIADMFIKTEAVQLVLVWAIVGNKLIIKIRNTNLRKKLQDEIIDRHFPKEGGSKHNSSGGITHDLRQGGETPDKDSLVKAWNENLEKRYLR